MGSRPSLPAPDRRPRSRADVQVWGEKKTLASLRIIYLELCSLTLFHDIFGIEYFLLSIKNDCTLCLDTFGYFFFPCSVSTSINKLKGFLAPVNHSDAFLLLLVLSFSTNQVVARPIRWDSCGLGTSRYFTTSPLAAMARVSSLSLVSYWLDVCEMSLWGDVQAVAGAALVRQRTWTSGPTPPPPQSVHGSGPGVVSTPAFL